MGVPLLCILKNVNHVLFVFLHSNHLYFRFCVFLFDFEREREVYVYREICRVFLKKSTTSYGSVEELISSPLAYTVQCSYRPTEI